MKALLVLAAGVLVVQSAIVALLVGEGLLIHWIFPAVDITPAVIAATGATGMIVAILIQTVRLYAHNAEVSSVDELEDEDEDDEDFDVDGILDTIAKKEPAFHAKEQAFHMSLPSLPPLRPRHPRRRKKK